MQQMAMAQVRPEMPSDAFQRFEAVNPADWLPAQSATDRAEHGPQEAGNPGDAG